ncbi:MAG: hypothetical protein WAZ19_15060 [Anaerolineae bacterium]
MTSVHTGKGGNAATSFAGLEPAKSWQKQPNPADTATFPSVAALPAVVQTVNEN